MTGVVIHDLAGATHFESGRLPRAFRVPRDVNMVVETNMAEDPVAQPFLEHRRLNVLIKLVIG